MATTATEARFRIDAKPQPPRTTSVVALDDGAMSVVRGLADQEWNAARFLGCADGADGPGGDYADLQLRTVDGHPVRLSEELAEADFVMMIATEGRGAAAAATIGDACTLRGIMTAGLIVGRGRPVRPGADRAAPQRPGAAGHRRRAGRHRAARGGGRVSAEKVTLADLGAMKRDGRKIVGVVAWDYQIARIVDRVGVEIVSVGDTVGMNLWGQTTPFEVTMDQMVIVCQAVRRGCPSGAGQRRLPVRAAAGGSGRGGEGGDPAGQGGRRRPGQAGRRGRPPGRGAGRRPRRHPGVRAARGHPAGGAAARARLRRDGRAGRAGAGGDGRAAGRRGQGAGAGRRGAAGLHQLRPGGRGRGGPLGVHPGARRLRRRSLAGRPGTDGARGDRLRGGRPGRPAGHVRRRRARIAFDALTAYAADVRAAKQIRGGVPVPS